MNLNLNDHIVVKLTDYGVRVLLDYEEKKMSDVLGCLENWANPKFPTVHEQYHVNGNEWRFQFHKFMDVFGSHLANKNVLIDYNVVAEVKGPDYAGDVAKWENLMMELVGEDGFDSVRDAITRLKEQNRVLLDDFKAIRDHIGAEATESTYDEVVRLTVPKTYKPDIKDVWLVQRVNGGGIFGCFTTREKAINYIDRNSNLMATNIEVV
jgi:hypothetical protein